LGHTWAWIIISVSVVILISITLWVVVSGKTVVDGLAGRDVVHQISLKWRDRWSQAPGPPSVYSSQASAAVQDGLYGQAAMRLSMSLGLDSNRAEDWVHMACLSAIEPRLDFTMNEVESRTIVSLLNGDMVEPQKLAIAQELGRFTKFEATSYELIRGCFGVSSDLSKTETGDGTLDTIPVSP